MILFVQCSAGHAEDQSGAATTNISHPIWIFQDWIPFEQGVYHHLHIGVLIDLLFDTAQVWVWHWMPKAFARTSASESPKKGGYPQRRTNMMTWRKVFWKSAGCFWDLSTKEDFKTRIIAMIGPWSRQVVHIAHHLLNVFICSCVILCLYAKSGGVSISFGPRILGQCFLPFTNQQISSVVGILKNPKQFGLTRRNKGKHAEQYTTAPEICGLRASGWGHLPLHRWMNGNTVQSQFPTWSYFPCSTCGAT